MADPTPPLDLDAIQRALEHLMWLANTGRGKSPEAVLTAFSLARQAGLLVERVRVLEAEVARLQARPTRGQACYICGQCPVVAHDADNFWFCARHAGADCTPL